MQLDERQLLFYSDALYKFANEISRRTNVAEIFKGMLSIINDIFGIKKGMALVRHTGDTTFELATYENLDSPTIQGISQRLNSDIQDDLEEVNGLVELIPAAQSSATPASLSELMASVGMTTAIALRTQKRLTAYVGLEPLASHTPFSENQTELLSALTENTEIALENKLFYQEILQENQQLKEELNEQYQFHRMVGQSDIMQKIYQRIQQVALYPNYSVLISGESGTGKDLIAKAIHHYSARKDSRFLPINCVAVPQQLFESELFGYEKGAFTGADTAKIGFFESAKGGTLFLDEIAEIPAATQGKLLRALEQKEIMRIGGRDAQAVDVRIIAATNKNLKEAIANGQLRGDLFYRFDVGISTPPLRDRKEDIPLLVNVFLEEITAENGLPALDMSPQGLKTLMAYDWPGNVRQLRKALMEAAMVTEDNVIRAKDIPIPHDEVQAAISAGLSLNESIDVLRRTMIEKALNDNDNNKTKAGAQLGITRQNLQNMMRRMNIA
ncbi:sigma 54-interacting transcriptional regulator [Candidatus Poribacteria bacterium]